MISKYKEYKRNKYENELNKLIKINQLKAEEYMNDVEPNSSKFGKHVLCRNYTPNFINELIEKYNVNKELTEQVSLSEKFAINEHKKMYERLKHKENKLAEKEKIKLYKMAILELKKENLI